ncbi:class I SAM-dependent methyltransferase [Lentzea atacamensis]|uniref:class I SAM-dependent methyltransferase n=1 Tax=Lentzea atacamensis TaxID=531938 RepID=UPI000DD43BCE
MVRRPGRVSGGRRARTAHARSSSRSAVHEPVEPAGAGRGRGDPRPAPGQVLLDLACGRSGHGLEIVRRTGCRLMGVDFSAVAIDQARQRAVELAIPPSSGSVSSRTSGSARPPSTRCSRRVPAASDGRRRVLARAAAPHG